MSVRAPRAVTIGQAGLTAGALVVATLVPLAPDQPFPSLPLGLLIAVAGFGFLGLALAAYAAAAGEPARAAERLDAAALWSGCALAGLGALAAVAATAESLEPLNIVLAQRNTSLYVVRQPVAAWIYLVALALAGQESALLAVLGPPSRARSLALVSVTISLAALGATAFLGGFDGPHLPGSAWVAIKTGVVALAVIAIRFALRGLTAGGRLAIAWAAAGVGVLNLIMTLALAMR
jgi:NADH-quinone oxidoreductase subunit H